MAEDFVIAEFVPDCVLIVTGVQFSMSSAIRTIAVDYRAWGFSGVIALLGGYAFWAMVLFRHAITPRTRSAITLILSRPFGTLVIFWASSRIFESFCYFIWLMISLILSLILVIRIVILPVAPRSSSWWLLPSISEWLGPRLLILWLISVWPLISARTLTPTSSSLLFLWSIFRWSRSWNAATISKTWIYKLVIKVLKQIHWNCVIFSKFTYLLLFLWYL